MLNFKPVYIDFIHQHLVGRAVLPLLCAVTGSSRCRWVLPGGMPLSTIAISRGRYCDLCGPGGFGWPSPVAKRLARARGGLNDHRSAGLH